MRGLLILAAAAAGCATMALQTDDFPERLGKGCLDVAKCELLVADAQARVARCQPNTIGYIRCSDARADLQVASTLLDQRRREVETRERVAREAVARADLQAQQANYERRHKEEAEATRREFEHRQQMETAAIAERTERDLLERERREKDEAAELERLRLLGRAGRDRELRDCYREAGGLCRALLVKLLEVADNDAEKRALVALDQKLADAPAPESGGGSLRCCDGSTSGCSCGGSHRGCCSHHGGVCGCN